MNAQEILNDTAAPGAAQAAHASAVKAPLTRREQKEAYENNKLFKRLARLVGQAIGDYKMIDQYLPSIDKVTAADVQRVAQKYLVKDNRTVAILEPTGMLPKQAGGGPSGGTVHRSMSFDQGGVR